MLATTSQSVASAPGKVILFGEHAVVHGATAVAASLSDLRVVVRAAITKSNTLEMHLGDLFDETGGDGGVTTLPMPDLFAVSNVQEVTGTSKRPSKGALAALERLFAALDVHRRKAASCIAYLTCGILHELVRGNADLNRGLRVEVEAVNLPVGAGLGSSAAFSVAAAGCLLNLQAQTFISGGGALSCVECADGGVAGMRPDSSVLDKVNEWAFASEVIIHGEPSGLDSNVSCYGGVVKFTKGDGIHVERLDETPPLDILLTNTKVPRETKTLVAGVRALLDATPSVVRPLFHSIDAMSLEFLRLVEDFSSAAAQPAKNPELNPYAGRTDAERDELRRRVGRLVHMNHYVLNALGVGHPQLDVIVAAAQDLGLSAKLTGAGGGGCALTLLRSQQHSSTSELKSRLRRRGFTNYTSRVGGAGLLLHTADLPPPAAQRRATAAAALEALRAPLTVDSVWQTWTVGAMVLVGTLATVGLFLSRLR